MDTRQLITAKNSLFMNNISCQSIKILQMSISELMHKIHQECNQNPFIEELGVLDEEMNLDSDNSDDYLKAPIRRNHENSNEDWICNIAYKKTLREDILEQINLTFSHKLDREIGMYFLFLLQDDAYITYEIEDIAKIFSCSIDYINTVLNKLHRLEPLGVFASSMQEYLIIQAKELYPNNSKLLKLISHIFSITKLDLKQLARLCNVELGEIQELLTILKTLNPRPLNNSFENIVSYKIPDIIMCLDSNNRIRLSINDQILPRFKVNYSYYLELKNKIFNKKESNFIKSEITTASNLIKYVKHRSATILKVAEAIVEEQLNFFRYGVMNLKPMNLKQIAMKTGFNESTISRATANKYLSTPSGIYELKYFFSSALNNYSTHICSSTKVKEMIKYIIQSEPKESVLSDFKIVEELRRFNVNLSRRTVNKYRHNMKISKSDIRKKLHLISN
ncbi:RNA polymerase factor sigma-54 [Rickettsia endosymbiont of Cardiosporidium cionae]|uniref:RNA polymerase factor sigma-54 n=1 Tax=Rickettsia endosymbiont of Cardiosporidium cionae TaxID=2777155 RepID=UPI00189458B3|nr:RNA polymerase factor sigma-54 [Rickettsia endosymbiont of Cardiosporidium cionae]KAF8818249.1 RNA polymerase sigma-54 factor 1 [Rickettsia endosymbiont of Cardiosporidium cionae]